uniref:Retrotransposon protein, putative, unclassified n=1 Tax=Oryza sativa subsp. japonica TaxID=39947 RepID=Q2QUU7_ORYSJ|nr:retrotransposon protein, putative, unclassified [Oryza sativa Japonica Group]
MRNKCYSLFDFDITKAGKIFDLLLREKQIQLPAGHVIPSAEELGKRGYCKWHNSGSHSTKDCKVFRQQIQEAIEGGKIKLDDSKKPMKVDGNPFPVNMVHTSGRIADGGKNRSFQMNSARIISKYQRKYDKQQDEYHEKDGGFDPHWDCEFFKFCWNEGIFTKNQKRRVQSMRNREHFQEVQREINHRLRKPKLGKSGVLRARLQQPMKSRPTNQKGCSRVQRLMRCRRASQFDPATDKICKQQIKQSIG